MFKKVTTIFFLLLFSVQLLPIRQVGHLIAGATMTEELPEAGSSKSNSGSDEKWVVLPGDYGNNSSQLISGQYLYIHFSEMLPSFSANEVQTPPPDLCC